MAHPYFKTFESTYNEKEYPGVLDVILVVSNTRMYESRYRLFKKVLEELIDTPFVRITIAELAFGRRSYHIADPANPQHVMLRSPDELWHKENMINLAIKRLPSDWRYVCWMDADISFVNWKDWARDVIESLQHYKIIQPWSHAIDLGPNNELFATYNSFASCYKQDRKMIPAWKNYGSYQHTGYAWAARRDFIDDVGGLIDFAVLGAADHHMAWSLIGQSDVTFPNGILLPEYRDLVSRWQDRAMVNTKKDVGCLPGTIMHYWHGKKKDRKYRDRWDILTNNKFNPYTDIVKDWQGLWRLQVQDDRQINLRDDIKTYFSSRMEDSLDMEGQ